MMTMVVPADTEAQAASMTTMPVATSTTTTAA
jgi:hypothetical protein